MNLNELAKKALSMQRDYTNGEIADLLGMRAEDLTTMIDAYKSGRLENKKAEAQKVPKPKARKKKTTQRSK